MKKVLFATTALIATAGIASADVALTGSAEMGLWGGSFDSPGSVGFNESVTQFFQDIDVTFTLSGETDSGITFGAAIDLDEVGGNSASVDAANDDGGVAIFISGDFGTLTMGDTDGGFDAGMQEVNIGSPGSIADNETEHAGYNGNSGLDGLWDGQVLSYSYSVSGFTITGSVEMDDDATTSLTAGPLGTPARVRNDQLTGDAVYGIGVAYAGTFGGGSYTVGAGYQGTADTHAAVLGDQNLYVVGVSATVALDSGLSAGLTYSMFDYSGAGAFLDFTGTHTGIGVSYTFDAISVHANYGVYDWDATALVQDSEGYGLAVGYDLGGDLDVLLGYNSNEWNDFNLSGGGGTDSDYWSLGLSMSF